MKDAGCDPMGSDLEQDYDDSEVEAGRTPASNMWQCFPTHVLSCLWCILLTLLPIRHATLQFNADAVH